VHVIDTSVQDFKQDLSASEFCSSLSLPLFHSK